MQSFSPGSMKVTSVDDKSDNSIRYTGFMQLDQAQNGAGCTISPFRTGGQADRSEKEDMNRRSFLFSSAAFVGTGLLDSVHSHPKDMHPRSGYAASLMADCAHRFVSALDTNQRGKAAFPFDTDERLNWHFIPRERKGLALREMSPYQKHLASALLAAGLSQAGYIKAVTIMSLEEVLRIIENTSGEYRNPEKYYFSIFGTPAENGKWGYRVEGHHFSQNYTIVSGKVIDAPSFFGANPAEVQEGARKGLRTLPGEDDLGYELIRSFDEPQ